MKRSSSFGEPKPLPGQTGYKLSQTVVLEKDAKEMEERLKMLQERLEKQRLEDAAVPKPGGSRWNSARVDKGSVLTYNKDLQEKYKKKVESQGGGDPALWITSTNKKEKRKTESHINYMNKDVKDWTMLDVSHWLIALNLEEYEEIFKVNQINGKVLIELTVDDLDYLNVKILNHRKLILKNIEILKNKMSQGKSNLDDIKSNKILSEGIAKESKELSTTYITSEAITKTTNNLKSHWSQLEPISSNVLISKPNDSAINAADSDVLDEEAEKILFQQAVMEWRNSNKSEDSKQSEPLVDSLWSNPLNDIEISNNVDIQSINKSKIKIIREYIKPISKTINDSDNESPSTHSVNQHFEILDEETEHQEFVKAVNEWRNNSNDKSKVSLESGTETIRDYKSTSKALVDKLSKDFDEEQNKLLQHMQQQKDDVQKKINETAKLIELERLKRNENISNDITDIENFSNEEKFDISDDLSEVSSVDNNISPNNQINANIDVELYTSHVEVELVESTLGLLADYTNINIEDHYIVEEMSDDD